MLMHLLLLAPCPTHVQDIYEAEDFGSIIGHLRHPCLLLDTPHGIWTVLPG